MAAGKKKSKRDHPKKSREKKADADTPVRPDRKAEPAKGLEQHVTIVEGASVEDDAASVLAQTRVAPSGARLTEMVPVRFDTKMLADVRARAANDHRSVSSWIRRAVDLELQRDS